MYSDVNVNQIAGNASNLRAGDNPPFSVADFLAIYPQFGNDSEGKPVVPTIIIGMHLDMAHSCIKESRFRKSWKIAMSYYIAHFCTIWLRTSANPADGKDAIIASGNSEGITISESVDGVSYSADASFMTTDLEGYAGWKLTSFGIQLATLCKMYGKGGMVVL